jgi:hypothetical protein
MQVTVGQFKTVTNLGRIMEDDGASNSEVEAVEEASS